MPVYSCDSRKGDSVAIARLSPAELIDVARDLRARQDQILDKVNEMDAVLESMKTAVDNIAINTNNIAKTLDGMGGKILAAVRTLIYSMGLVLGIIVVLAVASIMRVAFIGDRNGISINPQNMTVQAAP